MYYDQGPLDYPSRQPTYSGATFLPPSTQPSMSPSMQPTTGFVPYQPGGRRGVSYADYYSGRSGGSQSGGKPPWLKLFESTNPMRLRRGPGGNFLPLRGMQRGRAGEPEDQFDGPTIGGWPMPGYGGQQAASRSPYRTVVRGGDGQYGTPQVPRYNMPPSPWNGPQRNQMVPYL